MRNKILINQKDFQTYSFFNLNVDGKDRIISDFCIYVFFR